MEKIKGDITIEDIRYVSEHENLSDDQLQVIAESIIEFSRVLMMMHVHGNLSKE